MMTSGSCVPKIIILILVPVDNSPDETGVEWWKNEKVTRSAPNGGTGVRGGYCRLKYCGSGPLDGAAWSGHRPDQWLAFASVLPMAFTNSKKRGG